MGSERLNLYAPVGVLLAAASFPAVCSPASAEDVEGVSDQAPRVAESAGGADPDTADWIAGVYARIKLAEENDPHPAAGVYTPISGLGLGGVTAHVHPRVGIAFRNWSDVQPNGQLESALAVDPSFGGVSEGNTLITGRFRSQSDADGSRLGVPDAGGHSFTLMSWDDAWVLVPESTMLDFVADLNNLFAEESEVRGDARNVTDDFDDAWFKLEDDSTWLSGAPELPARYAPLLRRNAAHARVLAVDGDPAPPADPWSWRTGRVALYGEDLHPGMTFKFGRGEFTHDLIRIERVIGPFAEGWFACRRSSRDAYPPLVDQIVSTWRGDPVIEESRTRVYETRRGEEGARRPRPGVRLIPERRD